MALYYFVCFVSEYGPMPRCLDGTGASFLLVHIADGRGWEYQMDGSLSQDVYISSKLWYPNYRYFILRIFSLSNSPKKETTCINSFVML